MSSLLASHVTEGMDMMPPHKTDRCIAFSSPEQAQALTATHLQHEALLDAINEHALVSSTDFSGCITYINPRFQAVSQYSPEELIGKTHGHISSGLHPREFYEGIWRTLGRGDIWRGEICNRKKDGSLFWVDAAIVPARNNVGEITGFTAVSLDITARKEEIEHSHASLATLRALLETIPYPIFLKDHDFRYVECNEEFCRMQGKSREEIIGHTPYDIAPSAQADVYLSADLSLFASESGQQIYETSLIGHDGSLHRVKFHKRLYRGSGGEPEGLVGIVIDVTDFRKTESELLHHRDHLTELVAERTSSLLSAKEEAEHANRVKSEFLANISHELRTPLHAILSFARLAQTRLQRGNLSDINEFLSDIYSAGQRQLSLVNDLLDLAKIEAGKLTIAPVRQDIRPLLEDCVRSLSALLDAKGLCVRWQTGAHDTQAWADAPRMQQVFTNLLANAIRFSAQDTCLIIHLDDDTLPQGRRDTNPVDLPALRIELEDAGVGIPEDELERIFDKFEQSRRTNRGAGGTGLGLAICREIVQAHFGQIEARNNPGIGATFSVRLPRAEPAKA